MEIGLNNKISIALDDLVRIDIFLERNKKLEKIAKEIYLYKYEKLEATVYLNDAENGMSFVTSGNVTQREFSEYVDDILRTIRKKIIENFEIWQILEKFAYVNVLLKEERLETESICPSKEPI